MVRQSADERRKRDRERKRDRRAVIRDRCAYCRYREDCTWAYDGAAYCSPVCLTAAELSRADPDLSVGDARERAEKEVGKRPELATHVLPANSDEPETWTNDTLHDWWARTRSDSSAPHFTGAFENAEDWHVAPARPRDSHLGPWEGCTTGTDGNDPVPFPLPRDLMSRDLDFSVDPDRAGILAEARQWFRENPEWYKSP